MDGNVVLAQNARAAAGGGGGSGGLPRWVRSLYVASVYFFVDLALLNGIGEGDSVKGKVESGKGSDVRRKSPLLHAGLQKELGDRTDRFM